MSRDTRGPWSDDDETYPFDPDYTLVSKADLAAVLTVYEAHTSEDVRPFCPWYLRCKEALGVRNIDSEKGTES